MRTSASALLFTPYSPCHRSSSLHTCAHTALPYHHSSALQSGPHCTPLPPYPRLLSALHHAQGPPTLVPCAGRSAGTPAAIPAVADGPSSAAADPPSSSAAPPPPPAGPAADGGEVQPAAGQEVPPPPPPTSEAPAASTAEGASLAPAAQAPTQVPAGAAAVAHPSAPPTSSAATAVGAGAGPSAAGTQAANGVAPAAPSLPNGLAQGSRATQVTGFPAGAGPPPPPPPPTSLGHDSDGVNGLGAGGPGADTGAAFLLQDPITAEPLPTPRDNGVAVGDEEMAQASSTEAQP